MLAAAAFLTGILSLFSAVLALTSENDFILLGVIIFLVLAFVFGIRARRVMRRGGGPYYGMSLAIWGMAIPVVGFGLGFLVLPHM